MAFFIWHSRTKTSKYCCHPPFHPPIFCRRRFFKTFVTHPPKINELDTVVTPTPCPPTLTTPKNLERAPSAYPAGASQVSNR